MRRDISQLEEEFSIYVSENHFLQIAALSRFSEGLIQEGNGVALIVALEDFERGQCPMCGEVGFFRWSLFGHVTHPDCWRGHVSPLAYAKRQLRAAWWAGKELGGSAFDSSVRDPDFAVIVIMLILYVPFFAVGFAIRLAFGMIALPVQMVVYLAANRKP